ncbi:MAG: hypothetical protein L0211_23750 [Planctomycetaceae bacterium]|nr:hypothetical protein [Planctomycetaceae bacterium]
MQITLARPLCRLLGAAIFLAAGLLGSCGLALGQTPVDVTGYDKACTIRIGHDGKGLVGANWPAGNGLTASLALDVTGQAGLVREFGLLEVAGNRPILSNVDPTWFLTTGERRLAPEKPPEQKWEVFFDNPHQRPHKVFASQLDLKQVRVTGKGSRAKISINTLTIGPFSGSLEFTFYAGSGLVRMDAVVETKTDGLAIFYDAGLMARTSVVDRLAWMDTEGRVQRVEEANAKSARPVNVRHRTIIASDNDEEMSVACFPPPHQFQFPRDYSSNLGFVWHGRGYQGQGDKFGFGIRQNKDGGGNFVPWFNGVPGVKHRLGMFLLLTPGNAEAALKETLRLTHGDRFPELPGHLTLTSHYHMAIAVTAMEEKKRGVVRKEPPDYLGMFKEMGVNIVHLGEFHGDGHPKDPGPLRLPEMKAMFDECHRWSDERLLLLPGEEGNDHLGMKIQGQHPGHWMCLFPRPVYWTMVRGDEQPFVEEVPEYGRVYHVGSRGDMIRLLKEERGLAWTAHPRIKASSWTPDAFRHEDFFLAEYWLGGAWKAMPGDLSREKQGERVLNLLDDMANWGQKKYILGEVDVFKLDHTHELYGHMNINYVRLDKLPKYTDSWQPVLDVLSRGQFFVTTGEILLPQFTVGGQQSGDVLKLGTDGRPELLVEMKWTFPLAFAEVISGDGSKVYRERIDLADTPSFGTQMLKLTPELAGRKWVRFEVWDIAANGAFTQPVWLE